MENTRANLLKIGNMLNNARQSTTQVGTDVSFKRPDRAYVEYLIGTELLLNVIPKHKDYPSLIAKQGEMYRALCKVSRSSSSPKETTVNSSTSLC